MGHLQNDLSKQAIINFIEASLFDLIKLRIFWSKTEVTPTPEMLTNFKDGLYPHFNVILRAKLSQFG